MQARTIVQLEADPCEQFPTGIVPIGSVLTHPDAYKLVRRGCAVPADDECKAAADMSDAQMQMAQQAYLKVSAGLLPEDYSAWDRGYMRGYNPDGSWIRGPNADELEEEEWEQHKQHSDLWIP